MNKTITPQEAKQDLQEIKEFIFELVGEWPIYDELLNNVESFINQQLRKTEPLTEEERKELDTKYPNGYDVLTIGSAMTLYMQIPLEDRPTGGVKVIWNKGHLEERQRLNGRKVKTYTGSKWIVDDLIIGIGHTKAEAERDAYTQYEERAK